MVKTNKDIDLNIYNLDGDAEKNKYRNKSPMVPQHPFRWIISGSSGCGKTNLLLNFIYRLAEFDILYIYTKHPDQPKFKTLIDMFITMGREGDLIIGTSSDDITPPEEMDSEQQNLVVCDDLLLEKDQDPIVNLFIRGRHSNASVIYLTQSYFKVPRNIRLQAGYFSFFEINRREMLSLYQELGNDLEKDEFFRRLQDATLDDYSFLHIDKVIRIKKLRYRKGFNGIYVEP